MDAILAARPAVWLRLTKFVAKWTAFFRPVEGWKHRLRCFRRGQTVWSVPGREDANKVVPWPVEWLPHELTEPGPSDDQKRGFRFLEAECTETGKLCAVGVGLLCVRCGIALHPSATTQVVGFDPPACSRCDFITNLVR